ncbi:pyridoxal phosphate-dependent aminotransferase [Actibacterium sp. 188UL27-1]|uniref:pyridoxal phosphate-dependent aminotransferase n=1 Tax=Actibacterium sp. 188UL27-1 TaxID=2786961 RepID=UPI00195CDF1C|nr:aminotransferase class I/II-fold pyridoxal phosphate-dependent enzyme [Actibacterium sp. 188UL27-1]MBM7067507.1 aminotransferase class I/II-fold pyridoxal phosphate-dependent enzyme [Actibacterium sp. 188UL27-1]
MRSSRRSEVDPFIVMDVMEAARQAEEAGRHVIHMEVGQPGTPAPQGARDALARALQSDALGYTVALGLPTLRQRIARLYGDWYGLDLNPDRVIVTPGASGAFILAFTALFEAGDRVGLGLPGYPSYRHILTALSLQAVGLPAAPENRLQPVPSDVPADLSGLILASPANPSGTMLDRTALSGLVERAEQIGAAVISDEIYHGLHYDNRAISALEVTDDVVAVNSFSKYFSMTGWRIGWMVVPESQIRTYERLAQNLFICPPHASQIAALAALDCIEECEASRTVYAANRQLMIDGLPKAGITNFAPPDGAFYIYADVSDLTNDSREFASQILAGADVAVTPGLDFDPARGGTMLRFSYARATEDIAEGLFRLERFMAQR